MLFCTDQLIAPLTAILSLLDIVKGMAAHNCSDDLLGIGSSSMAGGKTEEVDVKVKIKAIQVLLKAVLLLQDSVCKASPKAPILKLKVDDAVSHFIIDGLL